jgi:hypothetical protein
VEMCRYYGCEANLMVSVCITLCRWTATARLSMPLNDRGISDYNGWWEIIKFIVVTHPQNKKSKRRRCYQQICSEQKQTSGLYLITSLCCWTWWLHVLTWTLKLYSLNVSGNVSFMHFAFMIIFAIDSMLCDTGFCNCSNYSEKWCRNIQSKVLIFSKIY